MSNEQVKRYTPSAPLPGEVEEAMKTINEVMDVVAKKAGSYEALPKLIKKFDFASVLLAADTLARHIRTLQPLQGVRVEKALRGLVEKLKPMMEAKDYKPLSRDHACSKCLAGYGPEFRELVIDGFQCHWHEALAVVAPLPTPAENKEDRARSSNKGEG